MTGEADYQLFIDLLIEERQAFALFQEDLDKQLGLGRGTINDWERGRQRPRLDNFIRWGEALGFQLKLVRGGMR